MNVILRRTMLLQINASVYMMNGTQDLINHDTKKDTPKNRGIYCVYICVLSMPPADGGVLAPSQEDRSWLSDCPNILQLRVSYGRFKKLERTHHGVQHAAQYTSCLGRYQLGGDSPLTLHRHRDPSNHDHRLKAGIR